MLNAEDPAPSGSNKTRGLRFEIKPARNPREMMYRCLSNEQPVCQTPWRQLALHDLLVTRPSVDQSSEDSFRPKKSSAWQLEELAEDNGTVTEVDPAPRFLYLLVGGERSGIMVAQYAKEGGNKRRPGETELADERQTERKLEEASFPRNASFLTTVQLFLRLPAAGAPLFEFL
ncbi:hypothetical protein WN48_05750 [Eufriesea mexicana]|uniref:Uncharacterized protein n=1 Tax=Eufriesea mexicana TaxID=516756 RepID=A0A310SK94_9HYME|nr:hypothetical protein WN48_05750 [Eufriesea mexicana]